MTDLELLREALNALTYVGDKDIYSDTIDALRARLSQPEQEPVAWKMKGVPAFATSRPNDTDSIKWDALYTAPPQREWVGLTDEEAQKTFARHNCTISTDLAGILARAITAKLKEKNK